MPRRVASSWACILAETAEGAAAPRWCSVDRSSSWSIRDGHRWPWDDGPCQMMGDCRLQRGFTRRMSTLFELNIIDEHQCGIDQGSTSRFVCYARLWVEVAVGRQEDQRLNDSESEDNMLGMDRCRCNLRSCWRSSRQDERPPEASGYHRWRCNV